MLSARAVVAVAFAAAVASACAGDVSGPGPHVQAAVLPSPPGSPKTVVTISGDVTLAAGFTVHVGAAASGSAVALTGQGFDTPFRGNLTGTPGYCRFPLTGSLSGSVVTLSGAVTFSSDPTFVGVPVTITADGSTGGITFDFGPFTLTGTGSVVVAHP